MLHIVSRVSSTHGDPPGGRSRLLVGGLFSLGLGLLLALAAFAMVVLFEGVPTRGTYCSEAGIGRYEAAAAGKMVAYVDEGWSGIPPAQHCRVYLVETTNANPPLSAEESLRRDPPPHELLAVGSYPGTVEYAWVLGALLLPLAIWALLAITGVVGPQTPPGSGRHREPNEATDL